MLRAIILFLGLLAVAVTAAWLADHPGDIALDWGQFRIETSVAVAGALIFVVVVLSLALYRFWRWLVQGPTAWRQRRQDGRQRRGFDVLTQGLVAVAAGDSSRGRKLARRADSLLEGSPLTLLLSAQAAQLDGDEAGAKRYFEALRAIPDTAFLGVRGLLVLAKRAGEHETVRPLAEEAFRLRPEAGWAANELYLAQVMDDDWGPALQTVEQAGRRNKSGSAENSRRRAIALYGQALQAETGGEPRRALDRALKAVSHDPTLVPASALAVRLHAAAGDRRKAQRLLGDAWKRSPHPDLALAFAELHAGGDAAARQKAAERLAQVNADDAESQMLIARFAIDAGDWAAARRALERILDHGASVSACLLQARLLELQDGESSEVQRWLERAATAVADPSWLCGTCGWRGTGWSAICPHCGDFDSLAWGRAPGQSRSLAVLDTALRDADEAAIVPPAELLQMEQNEAPGTTVLTATEKVAGD